MLNAQTITDEIKLEHGFLLAELARLDGMMATLPCGGDCNRKTPCEPHIEQRCQELLDDFSTFLLGAMQAHFAHEERHMKTEPDAHHLRDMFERHKEAHADLTLAVSSALFADNTKEQRKSLSNTISNWLTEHIDTHDQRLVEWLTSPAQ